MIGGETVGHGESPECANWTTRKARKHWTCCECGSSIKPGEKYKELSGVWRENGPQRFRYCASCYRWSTAAYFNIGLEEYPLGALAESIAYLTDQGNGEYYVEPRSRL